jgi:hypothetical protein
MREMIELSFLKFVEIKLKKINCLWFYQYKKERMLMKKIVLVLFLLLMNVSLVIAAYPQSDVIDKISWEPTSNVVRRAPGSDNWPTTWADDGHIYTIWGDGGGFYGDNVNCRAELGVARIEGYPGNLKLKNVLGCTQGSSSCIGSDWVDEPPKWKPECDSENEATFGGKSYGIISVNGVLYMLVSPKGSMWEAMEKTKLAWSSDYGANWQLSSNIFFDYTDGFGYPTFLNYGKDNAGARDNYVYIYSADVSGGENAKRTGIVLARVPKDKINDRFSYSFFAGLDTGGNPKWSTSSSQRVPILENKAQGVALPSISYNSKIGRYLLVVPHASEGELKTTGLGIFDAPEPWGPWTTAYFKDYWLGSGEYMFFGNIPTKWISSDGLTFYLVFTGFGSKSIALDAYQHLKGTITLADTSGCPDGSCDASESCSSCPQDCGDCPPPPPPPSGDELVGHWTMDSGDISSGVLSDKSGNNNDGIIKGNPD